jgi:hypothetical protein
VAVTQARLGRIGAPVRAVFERIDETITPPRWVLER